MNPATAARWLLDRSRRKWVLAILVVISLIITMVSCSSSRKDAKEARQEATEAQQGVTVLEGARRSDEAALGSREASRTVILVQEELNSADTEAALGANPDWSSQPVPAAVLDSLRK